MQQHPLQLGRFHSGRLRLRCSKCPSCYGHPCTGFLILAVVLSLSSVHAVPSAVPSLPPYWYDPPCQHNFSWTTNSGRTQESKLLSMHDPADEQACRGFEYCPNPLELLPDNEESRYPPPVENHVGVTYYTTEFKYSDSTFSEWAGMYSAINITFQLGPEAAGKVTGVLFSIEGLSPDYSDYHCNDFKVVFCRIYRFVPRLTSDAWLGPNNRSLQLFFDCFRGQDPGRLYEYTIRTLPLMDTSGADPHDTVVKFRYRSPSCYSVPDDYYCTDRNTRPPSADIALCSYWKPQFFTVTAKYRDLFVVMELGPENCHFDSYMMAVHSLRNSTRGTNLWGSSVNVHAANSSQFETIAYERNITYVKVDFKDVAVGQRVVTVTPKPTPNSCFNNDGRDRPCSVTLSAVVTVIENPCVTDPCSSLEFCQPIEDEFVCVCKPGYIRDGYACVKNPCQVLDRISQEPYNPCDPGSCVITGREIYSCNCMQGLVFVQGTCKVDPCVPNPCGNGTCRRHIPPAGGMDYSCRCQPGLLKMGKVCKVDYCLSEPCGSHGTCKHSGLSLNRDIEASFICECSVGYQFDNRAQSCQVSTGTLIAVTITSLLLAALLLLMLVVRRRRRNLLYSLCKAVKCWTNGGSHSDVQQVYIPSQTSIPSQMSSIDDAISSSNNLGCPQEASTDTERTEILLPILRRINVLLLHSSGDHPLHENAVEKLASLLQGLCMCDVALPQWCWQDIQRRGLSEWLSHVLDRADKVILLCSKGTQAHWRARSPTPTNDILMQALPMILGDEASLGWSNKYAVAHLEYSSRSDIPAPLRVNAVYCLMKHMDALFFQLHGLKQGSPESKLRARNLEEDRYADATPQGAALHGAIQLMRQFQKKEPNWYERFHGVPSQGEMSSDTLQDTVPLGTHFADSHSVDEKEFESALTEFLNTTSEV